MSTYQMFGGSPYVEGGGIVSSLNNYNDNGTYKIDKLLLSVLTVFVVFFLVISTFSQKLIGWSRFLVPCLVGILVAQEMLDLADLEKNELYRWGAHGAWFVSFLVGWIYSKEA